MSHSVDLFPIKSLGDRSGWNKVHTVLVEQDCYFAQINMPIYLCKNLRALIC